MYEHMAFIEIHGIEPDEIDQSLQETLNQQVYDTLTEHFDSDDIDGVVTVVNTDINNQLKSVHD